MTDLLTPSGYALGRTVWHDPASKQYPIVAELPQRDFKSVRHERHIPVLNQGNLGSCTGNAGTGLLGTGFLYNTLPLELKARLAEPEFAEDFAVHALYSPATVIDPYVGAYPPQDTGSSGLSIAKVVKKQLKLIDQYRWAFSWKSLLVGLQENACMVGTAFFDGMERPDRMGLVHPSGDNVGGHEYVCDEFVLLVPGKPFADDNLLGFTNSWGTRWGVEGRFFMKLGEFREVLQEGGDAVFFIPRST
jgi:hypothetical protein